MLPKSNVSYPKSPPPPPPGLGLCPAPFTKAGSECMAVLEPRVSWEEGRAACKALGRSVGGQGDLAQRFELGNLADFIREFAASFNVESKIII